jgi:hypothetical protein
MKKFPPLILTEDHLTDNFLDDKLPDLKISLLILRDIKTLESYELRKCSQKYTRKDLPVRFAKVRSTVMDYGNFLTEISLENVNFHGFIELFDVLLSAPKLELLTLHKVSIKCEICVKSYQNIFKHLKKVKITETEEKIYKFLIQFVDKSKVDYTKKTVTPNPVVNNFRYFYLRPNQFQIQLNELANQPVDDPFPPL